MIVISLPEAKWARGALGYGHPDSVANRERSQGLPNRRSSSSSALSDHRSILLRPRRIPEADDEGPSESNSVSTAVAEVDTTARCSLRARGVADFALKHRRS